MKITLPDSSQCTVTLSYIELLEIYNVFLLVQKSGKEAFSDTQYAVFEVLQTLFEPSRGKVKGEQEKSADKSDAPNS